MNLTEEEEFEFGEFFIIVENKCQCSKCGDTIISEHRHDFVYCSCRAIYTDGGNSYLRRGFTEFKDLIDLTVKRVMTKKEILEELKRVRLSSLMNSSLQPIYLAKIKTAQKLLAKYRALNLV